MSELQAIIKPVWRRDDAKAIQDAIALWRRLGALPKGVDAQARARELCAVAYAADELIGVSTISLGPLPALRARFGFFRCLVAPEHRRSGIARTLLIESRAILSAWSQAHPADKIAGMAAIIENRNLDEIGRLPVWPQSGLVLIGYTQDGRQIRVSWFEHARLA